MTDGIALPGCCIEIRGGLLCEDPVLPGAPFPICSTHASELYLFVQRPMRWQERLAVEDPSVVSIPADGASTVYYVAMLGFVKIGWTSNLRKRLSNYPASYHLLATESGDLGLERRRQMQFAHLHAHRREYFAPAPDLIEHINALRATDGSQPISGPAAA